MYMSIYTFYILHITLPSTVSTSIKVQMHSSSSKRKIVPIFYLKQRDFKTVSWNWKL